MRRVLGYARVSSAEQALGTSLRDQQESIKAYAKSRGLTVTRFFIEAESAIQEKIERREQMQALMRDVRAGDLVLCDKLDRWSRDPEFTYRSVRTILEAGASFYAVSDRCDPSTAEGDTALGFRVLFAREEHKRIKERLVGTRNLLRAQGYFAAGIPPLGYRRGAPRGQRGVGQNKNVLVIVPEEAKIVRTIFRRYVAGESMPELARALDTHLSNIKHTLHRRVYIGEVQGPPSAPGRKDGPWIKGHHEPIIDAALFKRAQETIERRRLGARRGKNDPNAKTATWILRNVARCGRCGAKMSASYGHTKRYYRCYKNCTTKYVRFDLAEEAFAPLVLARLSELREALATTKSEPRKTVSEDFGTKRAKLQRRRENLLNAIEDGLVTREELRARMSRIDEEARRLDDAEAAARAAQPLDNPGVRRELLREVRALAAAWRHATPAERREIVETLTEAVALEVGKPPRPKWRSAEDLAWDA